MAYRKLSTVIQTHDHFDKIDKAAKHLRELVDEVEPDKLPTYMDRKMFAKLSECSNNARHRASELVVLAHDELVSRDKPGKHPADPKVIGHSAGTRDGNAARRAGKKAPRDAQNSAYLKELKNLAMEALKEERKKNVRIDPDDEKQFVSAYANAFHEALM
jgi:hypothetical protein